MKDEKYTEDIDWRKDCNSIYVLNQIFPILVLNKTTRIEDMHRGNLKFTWTKQKQSVKMKIEDTPTKDWYIISTAASNRTFIDNK